MEKVVHITSIDSKQNDFEFWSRNSYHERLAAIEMLRQQYYSINKHVPQGFQRVCTISRKRDLDVLENFTKE